MTEFNPAEWGLGDPISQTSTKPEAAPQSKEFNPAEWGLGEPLPVPPIPPSDKQTGYIANTGAAINEAAAQGLGLPVDLVTAGLNLVPRGINAVAGTKLPTIENPVAGSDWWKSAFGLVGADPRNVAAATPGEQYTRAAVRGAASMALPGALASSLPRAAGPILGGIQDAFAGGATPGMTALGGAAGVGGQAAANQVPDRWKPLADFGGQMAFGFGIPAAGAALKGAYNLATGAAGHYVKPFIGRVQQIADEQGNAIPSAIRDPISGQSVGPVEATPGQQSLAGERIASAALDPKGLAAKLQNPEVLVPGSAPTTFQASGDLGVGNLERASAVQNSPMFLDRANQQNAARVGAVTGLTRENANPADISTHFKDLLAGIDQQFLPRIQGATTEAQQFLDRIGGRVPASSDTQTALQSFGQRIRGEAEPASGLAGNQAEHKAAVGRLWDAVDPEGKLTLPGDPVASDAATIQMMRPKAEKPMEGEAAAIFDMAQSMRGVQPFREMAALRGRTTDELRNELRTNGNSQTYRALTQLLKSIENNMGEAVASSPAAQSFNYDAASAQRYAAARQGTSNLAQTFIDPLTAPGVAQVLEPGARSGQFKLGLSQVPATIFTAGKGAAERMQAYLKAGGDAPSLNQAISDYAAYDLRRAAEGPNGILDPKKYDRWMAQHNEAMTALPDLRQKFVDAATAARTLEATQAQHVAVRQQIENSAASSFLGNADPVRAVAGILGSKTAPTDMRQIIQLSSGNTAAQEGIRRAIVENMLLQARGNALTGETGTTMLKSDVFQNFLRRNDATLREAFSPQQIQAMQNVAKDLQRANLSISGTKLPGGSNTAQDTAAVAQHAGGKPSLLTSLAMMEVAGEAASHVLGPALRIPSMVGTAIMGARRAAGMETVDKLVAEAMLNPALARMLLTKVPDKNPGAAFSMLGRQIRAIGAAAGTQDMDRAAR